MNQTYTAVIKQSGAWWIGWIEEVPGVNCQESTEEELLETLRLTLREASELNRREALEAAGESYERRPPLPGGTTRNARSAIPRHNEIDDNLARKICKGSNEMWQRLEQRPLLLHTMPLCGDPGARSPAFSQGLCANALRPAFVQA